MSEPILLTGAGGKVAAMIRPYLLAHFGAVKLTDLRPPEALAPGEEFHQADLTDLDQAHAVAKGVRGIVHLAGLPGENTWDAVLDASMKTTINALEAARLLGIERFVFASSNHVIGFYPRSERLDGNERMLPDSRYAVAKVFGEAALSLYADKYGMRTLSIRIGTAIDRPRNVRELSTFHHPEDIAQLIAIGIEHPDVRNDVVWGISDNADAWWDNGRAEALGYKPRYRAADFADSLPAGTASGDLADLLQGGGLTSLEFDGDPNLWGANALKRD
ncbi:NAD(P)-dependent oxidoreductase [Mesorhizobium sp. BR1-1-16]|uniref:NAD-dependent epimerase/dehydratase family protein n=1 Tax=Mesorhizobium sp. BR1-1-16 TaxID=2876653 RepID=UPI001CCA8945|nr:NAD(P)-dependent oxidoreductase [Mesorhizobium sp. BR1-1-16]MBZ9938599.1 NAD(P)-dependent oxidoreductase [Mesorhizobium sp. BR1-1-16]